MIDYIGGFGFSAEQSEKWKSFSIDETLPTSDAIRLNDLVWLSDKADWDSLYPDLAKYPSEEQMQTFIALPFDAHGSSIGALGFLATQKVNSTAEMQSFLWTIAGLVGLYLSRESTLSGEKVEKITRRILTRRQNSIVDLLREGLTNIQIASSLGFSESTIRQETMRIYQLLHVTNRKEAAAFKFGDEE